MFNDKSGQMMLINAFLLAIAVVTITLMLNNVIYSSNIAYEGFMDQSRYDELSYKASIVNETAYAHVADPTNYGQYINDYEAYLNKLMIVKGRYVDISSTYPTTLLNIYGKESKVAYSITSTTTPTPTPTATPTPAKPYIVSLAANKSTLFTDGKDLVKLVVKVTDQNYVRQKNVLVKFILPSMGTIIDPGATPITGGTTESDGTFTMYYIDELKKDEGDVQIQVYVDSTMDPSTPKSNIVTISLIPAEPDMSTSLVPYTVEIDPKKQASITISFDFITGSISNGDVDIFSNVSYDNTKLLGSPPSYDPSTGKVNFVVTRIMDTQPGIVTLWCEVTGKDTSNKKYSKIEKITIYVQPMSSKHIPYTVTGNDVNLGGDNVNVAVTFTTTGFSNTNLKLHTIYPDTSNHTTPVVDSTHPFAPTVAGNVISFPMHKTLDPADVTFWVEVTGVSDTEVDTNVTNKAADKHLYYDTFEQIIVPILPAPPNAEFNSNVTIGNSLLTVQFNDRSTGGVATEWLWNFDDSFTSTVKNPIHTFPVNNGPNNATYTVTLTARNVAGFNTITKTAYITVRPQAPVASFERTPTIGSKPLTVQFTDKSSGSYLTYLWKFGDGATSIEQNPQHVYTDNGKYDVTLTVTNAGGTSSTTQTTSVWVKNN